MPPDTPSAPAGLTVADVAKRYRVGEDKVRRWIANGSLRAVNVASTLCGKPRWTILPEALAEFERQRAGGPPPRPPRRRRKPVIDYFPGL
jgi:excisionase family DNA binding protein